MRRGWRRRRCGELRAKKAESPSRVMPGHVARRAKACSDEDGGGEDVVIVCVSAALDGRPRRQSAYIAPVQLIPDSICEFDASFFWVGRAASEPIATRHKRRL
jgi:hypothetical protein